MGNLAATYSDLGRHEEALKLQEEVLQLRREKLGESHPDTLTSMGNLAATYSDLGRYDKALKLEEDALWLRREKLGESHPDSLLSMNNLGRDLQDLGRTDEALAIWRQALLLAQGTAHANLPIASTLLRNIQDALARRPDLREPGDPGNGADDPDNPGRQPPTANR
jgi:tetratricopeptide (TPR) repeat protein